MGGFFENLGEFGQASRGHVSKPPCATMYFDYGLALLRRARPLMAWSLVACCTKWSP